MSRSPGQDDTPRRRRRPESGFGQDPALCGGSGVGPGADDLLDRVLTDTERAEAYERLGSPDPDARAEADYFFGVQDLTSALKSTDSIAAPDFTGRVLHDVGRRRGFLNRRGRRWVVGSRLAAAGALLTLVGVFAVTQRAHPDWFAFWGAGASSIEGVEVAAQADAGAAIRALEGIVDRAFGSAPTATPSAASPAPDAGLAWAVGQAAAPRLADLDLAGLERTGLELAGLDLTGMPGHPRREAPREDAGWIWSDPSIRAEVGVSCGSDAGLGVAAWPGPRWISAGVSPSPLHPGSSEAPSNAATAGPGLLPLGSRSVPAP